MKTVSKENSITVDNQIYNQIHNVSGSIFGCKIVQMLWNKEEDLVVTLNSNRKVQIFSQGDIATVLDQDNVTGMDISSSGNITTLSSSGTLSTWTSTGEILRTV